MPALTPRRSDNPHQVTWHVYHGDVRVGTIGKRAGVPVNVHQCFGTSAEYKAGNELAIARGLLWRHERGTFVKFTEKGAELFA